MVARFIFIPVIHLIFRLFSSTPVRRSTKYHHGGGREGIFEGTTLSIRDIGTKQNGDRCSFSRVKTKTEIFVYF